MFTTILQLKVLEKRLCAHTVAVDLVSQHDLDIMLGNMVQSSRSFLEFSSDLNVFQQLLNEVVEKAKVIISGRDDVDIKGLLQGLKERILTAEELLQKAQQ